MRLIDNIKTRIKNRKLCKKYPFLRWWGDPLYYKTYNERGIPSYKYTWADELPEGWRKAFGNQIWDDLLVILKKANYEKEFRFVQIKEKWGSLRIYNNGVPEQIDEEISAWEKKYEDLSMMRCIICGKPTKYVTHGYVSFVCEDCAKDPGFRLDYTELTWEDIPICRDGNGNVIPSQFEKEWRKQWKKPKAKKTSKASK